MKIIITTICPYFLQNFTTGLSSDFSVRLSMSSILADE